MQKGAKVPFFGSYTFTDSQHFADTEVICGGPVQAIEQSTMKEQELIHTFIESHLEGSAFFLVDVLVGGSKRTPKVTVMLDGDEGIPIDDCAQTSRAVDAYIEELNLFPDGYLLEVSSPGVDQPLKFARQYPKHVGRELRVQLRDGDVKTGQLTAASEQAITIAAGGRKKMETVPATIQLADIEKAFVLVSFK